ncbi:sugar kinase [Anabaena sp. FACHB-1237]|uniref:PfkB family carbohydrate kinase n=1 Tax=Anabaena sp. FACHB-1237 TaxID=2692769 RepID=UPI00167FE8D0|nr:PfkB family carbohydrate kinase [Anabaena sp. FACHB-1237]MBD2139202.1 sugar kinase [Anabaena sp. FACHB-1237]
MKKTALFIGLITLDFIYLAPSFPQNNQKLVATDYTVTSGGPATNASVTFSYLGNNAQIVGILGSHPITALIKEDLRNYQVKIIDLDPNIQTSPPVSSIIVTENTGERAVISINAVKTLAKIENIPDDILTDIDIILIDGHQIAISEIIAQKARESKIPIVMDGGSWKSGLEKILPFVDYAIISANFYPPNCRNQEDILEYLQSFHIPHIAITQGEKPIKYISHGNQGLIKIHPIQPRDTLGAGDIFHGAFCHYILDNDILDHNLQNNFIMALTAAAEIAAKACKFFGTRSWMIDN